MPQEAEGTCSPLQSIVPSTTVLPNPETMPSKGVPWWKELYSEAESRYLGMPGAPTNVPSFVAACAIQEDVKKGYTSGGLELRFNYRVYK